MDTQTSKKKMPWEVLDISSNDFEDVILLSRFKKKLYFAIYYDVSDQAFQRVAETWQLDLKERMYFDKSSIFVMKKIKTEDEFKTAWSEINQEALDQDAVVVEGNIFSHASMGDKVDGLEFSGGTLTKEEIEKLPILPWSKSMSNIQNIESESILLLTSCNSGDVYKFVSDEYFSKRLGGLSAEVQKYWVQEIRKREWAPSEIFAKSQGIITVGQAGSATFSKEWERYQEITDKDDHIYLWAYQIGRNDILGEVEGFLPFLDKIPGKRLPALIAWPGCNPSQTQMIYDYDPKFGLKLMTK